MRLLAAVVCICGCVSTSSTVCEDGRFCPADTICDPKHPLCIVQGQLAACDGMTDGTACTAGSVTGHCLDGVCLPSVCGDGVVEDGELCDDGNTFAGDGCSASCTSNEQCGNQQVDMIHGEECDDGNRLDHDGCSSTCLVEAPHWVEHASAPPGRVWTSVAYDTHRDRLVLFGGVTSPGPVLYNDTWEWSGGEWTHVATPTAPASRTAHAMAYDASIQKTVLFGGFNLQSFLGDTWTWDGVQWSVAEIPGPSPRQGAAMAYDAKRKRIVLFGGAVIQASNAVENDETWEWRGDMSTWQKLAPQHVPPARSFASMSYDPVRGVIVMTGGQTGGSPSTIRSDTWTFDGTDWSDRTPATRPAVAMAGMAWDTVGQRTVLFGGKISDATASATTWAWDGNAWTTLAAGPSARSGVVLGQSAGQLVEFGGTNPPDALNGMRDTWAFANGWTHVVDPGPRTQPMLVDDRPHGSSVLYGGYTQRSPTDLQGGDTWTVTRTGYTHRADAPPAARSAACIAYDYSRNEVVMFGGATTTAELADTWIWNGSGWAQRTPAKSPPARAFAACAYDGHHVTLYGGGNHNESSALNDAWTWDGTTWTQLTTPVDLPPRTGAAAAYDPIRNQLVMFGGFDAPIVFLDDTWTYDGTTWLRATPGFSPSARNDAALVWNAARQRLVLLGGNGTSAGPIDAYEWDGTTWSTLAAARAPSGRSHFGAITSLDGAGVTIYGGDIPSSINPLFDRWDLRWDARQTSEQCTSVDIDGDGLVGCADPDCWPICTPGCPPGTSCDPAAPTCGDHVCDGARESCATCPVDCSACAAVCGDGVCSSGETGCPGDCS